MYENLLPRFLRCVKTETCSDATSKATPSTQTQVAFAQELKKELEELGLPDVFYNEDNGFVTGALPSNVDREVRSIGLIFHMDTADFNAVRVNPQIIGSYDGESAIVLNVEERYTLNTKDFPSLKNYEGHTLITTGGSTLLRADDKSGIAEVMTAIEILINNPSIPRGTIKVTFGPDEEIGVGADKSDVEQFNVDFAYIVDGGPSGKLQYETFSAAQTNVMIQGKNIHPGTVKDTMTSALQLAIDFHSQFPIDEVPEKTEGYEGFFHLVVLDGNPEETSMSYIIRDHDHKKFEARKVQVIRVREELNQRFDQERTKIDIYDQYYNMKEIIEKDMSIMELAKQAATGLGISPVIKPVRGGTDGLEISYMGIPTPDLSAGGENIHGQFRFVFLQVMERTTDVIIRIAELNTES